jgi:hypothetical protein
VRRTELVTAAVLVAAGLGTLLVLVPRYVDSGAAANVSPRFMPYVAAALLTAAALRLLGAALLRGGNGARAASSAPISLRFMAAAAAVLGGSYLAMSVLGYLFGGAVLVAGMLLVARAKPATIVVAAVLAPTVLWLVFARLLATPLP